MEHNISTFTVTVEKVNKPSDLITCRISFGSDNLKIEFTVCVAQRFSEGVLDRVFYRTATAQRTGVNSFLS